VGAIDLIIDRFLTPSTPRRRWGASASVTRTRAGNCRDSRRAAISDCSIAVLAEPLDMSLPVSRSTLRVLERADLMGMDQKSAPRWVRARIVFLECLE
jgi:hypothetical protein